LAHFVRLRLPIGLVLVLLSLPISSVGEPAPFESLVGKNILLIVADDIGVEVLRPYAEGRCSSTPRVCSAAADCPAPETCEPDRPATPTIDGLAAQGTLFRNAWSAPVCSPTRATILTGRYGFRTGVVAINRRLPDCELTIPEVLNAQGPVPGYDHAVFGKWHLAGGPSDYPECAGSTLCPRYFDHPNHAGFSHFEGTISNLAKSAIRSCSGTSGYCLRQEDCPAGICRDAVPASAYLWTQTRNGKRTIRHPDPGADPPVALEDVFATTVHVDAALGWIDGKARAPWFVYFNPNAAHAPWVVPPFRLVSAEMRGRLAGLGLSPGGKCPQGAGNDLRRVCYDAMIEAMDSELGRLISAVGPDTSIIFVGDNGTPKGVTEAPFTPSRQKSSLYEGGIHVPLIVYLAGGVGGGVESRALVNTTDLFGLVLDLAGAEQPRDRIIDGRGIAGLGGPSARARKYTFSEQLGGQTIRDARFKLIRFGSQPDELYDLVSDPLERVDRYDDPALAEQRARLEALLDELWATPDRCE
jgi:arylsulfatase A-like enzyme